MTKLPETLKRLRAQKGVYLKEVAPVLGVSAGALSNYEHGVHAPDLDTLKLLAGYYGVSVDYLLGRTDCPFPISAMNQVICGNFTVGTILDLMENLSEPGRQHLAYVLKLFELWSAAEK